MVGLISLQIDSVFGRVSCLRQHFADGSKSGNEFSALAITQLPKLPPPTKLVQVVLEVIALAILPLAVELRPHPGDVDVGRVDFSVVRVHEVPRMIDFVVREAQVFEPLIGTSSV